MKCEDYPTCHLLAFKELVIDRERRQKQEIIEKLQSILRNEDNSSPTEIFNRLASLFIENEPDAAEFFPKNMHEAFLETKKKQQNRQPE